MTERFRIPPERIDRSRPKIDDSVAVFERTAEFMRRRREFGRVAAGVERTLRGLWQTIDVDERTPIPGLAREVVASLQPTLEAVWADTRLSQVAEERIHQYTQRYVEQVIGAARREQWLFRGQDPLSPMQESENPQHGIAERIFMRRVGRAPLGQVVYERREGYMILSFERQDDFDACAQRGDGLPTDGYFFEDFPVGGKQLCSVMMVSGLPGTDHHTRIVEHERQHWLNNTVFNLFYPIEQRNRDEAATLPNDVVVKDELFATLRENTSADHVAHDVLHPSYDSLYSASIEPVPTAQDERIMVEVVMTQLALYDRLYPGTREELLYMLIDIPLAKITKFLSALLAEKRMMSEDTMFSPVK